MKTRKDLPRFGCLNFRVDVAAVLSELRARELLDWAKYTDIQVSAASKHKAFVIANQFNKDSFFKEETAPSLEGDCYKQLYLTDFDESKASGKVKLEPTNIFKRAKRLNPANERYLAEADELNYGVRNGLVTGELATVLNLFSSKLTRVRLAYLAPRFTIQPHVDYDPSYVVRYHVPLITNPQVLMHVMRGDNTASQHLPADGRVYFFNAGLKHYVTNSSDSGRLHLIVDVHGQSELDNLTTLIP